MLLYRYFASHAFDTLKEAKLKTSRISTFNDPFECMFALKEKFTSAIARKYRLALTKNPETRHRLMCDFPRIKKISQVKQFMRRNKRKIDKSFIAGSDYLTSGFIEDRVLFDYDFRIVCFSDSEVKPLDQILIWSHYTDSHKGIRIGFDLPMETQSPFHIFKIDYQINRVEMDYLVHRKHEEQRQALLKCLQVKSVAWSYEQEYRLLTAKDFCEPKMAGSQIEHFLSFKREWVKTVDFGVRCPEKQIKDIHALVKSDYPNVICRKAQFHRTDYAFTYEPF